MKNILLCLVACLVVANAFAQLEIRTFTWDDTEREYLEYLPEGYTEDEVLPVVFGLHGLGDNMNNFYNIGMNYMADTARFILIIPQALMATYMSMEIGTAWNSGASYQGIVPNVDVDDTGFLMAVLDSLENNYNIDTESVYFFGFSMGGYMCNRLAAEVGDRINAIASVSGTIGASFDPQPAAENHVACLHFHGTSDTQVPYESNTSGMDAEDLLSFWCQHNNNDETPVVFNYPDTQEDTLTFERYVYPNGDAQIAHIKVIGGKHAWYYYPNNDIDYATEIWTFFRYRFSESAVNSNVLDIDGLEIYPNPVINELNIRLPQDVIAELHIFNALGVEVIKETVEGISRVSMENFPQGMYFLTLNCNDNLYTRSVLKQ